MSDDWNRRGDDDEEDFGPPLFADEPTGELDVNDLSFGQGSTGPLPHWSDPPTGEIPRGLGESGAGSSRRDDDDVDVWSSFSGKSPVWGDDRPADDITGAYDSSTEPMDQPDLDGEMPVPPIEPPVRREPSRITIGTDPTGDGVRQPTRRPRSGDGRNGGRPSRATPPRPGTAPTAGTGGRDMPTAVAVGAGMAAVFLAVLMFAPLEVLVAVVALIIGLAAVEYFDTVTEKGYRPANVAGIAACALAPLVGYWVGDASAALPLVTVLAFLATAVAMMSAPSLDAAPLPNAAITMLGVQWIGLAGAFGGMILTLSKHDYGLAGEHAGTDTLCLIAVGVVANDIGALFIGSAAGRTPLRQWISPNKTVEGLIGGTVATLLAMWVVGQFDLSDTWNSVGDALLLGLLIAVFAPLGDLTESMFKRNLGVKDFGSLVKGHGGVLDRFDGFLFVLPAVWFLSRILEPWLT
jgi:phosphatidate cytidylyltransferase